jgi:hypothetical protein
MVSPLVQLVLYPPLYYQLHLSITIEVEWEGQRGMNTDVVVGIAVTLVAPVKALPFAEHISVMFLNHPLACEASMRPLGLVVSMLEEPLGAGGMVGRAVRDVLVE